MGTASSTLVGSSAWCRLDDFGAPAAQLTVTVSGTATVTVEGSDDDANANTITGIYAQTPLIAPSAMTWICPDTTNLGAKSASLTYELGVANTGSRPMWLRLTANSYSASASAKMVIVQSLEKYS